MNDGKFGFLMGSAAFMRHYNRMAHHFGHIQSKKSTIIILL